MKGETELILPARSVSRGVAIGKIVCLHGQKRQFYRVELRDSQIEGEVRRFNAAIRLARIQLRKMASGKSHKVPEATANILEVHRMMLEDPSLLSKIENHIREEQVNAEWAVKLVTDKYLAKYKTIADEYLRERYVDLEDVTERILTALGGSSRKTTRLAKNSIIAAKEVKPSTLVELYDSDPKAVITEHGGWTSHTFILAREIELPAVTGVKRILRRVKTGDDVIVDGFNGRIILHPEARTIRDYEATAAKFSRNDIRKPESATGPAVTLDGKEIIVRANVDLPRAYRQAKRVGAQGIGLYRSEFLFNQFKGFPTEAAQVEAYRKIAVTAGSDGVRIRTFDLGIDQLAEETDGKEKNPALGLRAIRLSIAHRKQFRTQIRALLQAAHETRIDIVLPMISDVGEIIQTRRMIEREKVNLARKRIPHGEPRIGAMIEVPSAVIMISEIAEEADFLCLGTNDLVQYMLATDRDNEAVADWFRSMHPAVIRAIRTVIQAADKAGKSIIVCGEMAGSPYYSPVLLGLGARELSMNVNSIPRVRKVITGIAYEESVTIAKEIENSRTADEAEKVLRNLIDTKWRHLFPEPFPT